MRCKPNPERGIASSRRRGQHSSQADWKRRPRSTLDSEVGSRKGQNIHSPRQRTNLFGKRPKGTDRKQWRPKCDKLALPGQGPVDTPDPELSEESRPLMPEPLVQLQVEEMNARYKSESGS